MDTSKKTGKILSVIFIAFLIILLRSWYLATAQRENLKIESEKPQTKTLLLKADRGTIYDRFHIPLAINRICYNAAIYYNQIAQIPTSRFEMDANGERKKVFVRKEYIRALAEKMALELSLDPDRIEDLIHAKASLFPHVPYVIQSHLTEEQYYRLKGLQKDWPGLFAEMKGERAYPQGKTACHIVGTMGAISPSHYQALASELSMLKEIVTLLEEGEDVLLPKGYHSFSQVYERLEILKEKAYSLSDFVGITGIEKQFEEELRGYFGKKQFEIDQKGELVHEKPGGKEPIAGQSITLSISLELQQFAEELLAKNEEEILKKKKGKKQWIHGSSIVVMDPNNGEILAMASYPRFDPNDFSQKQSRFVNQWLENESYLAMIWEGRQELTRERFHRRFFEEKKLLTWSFFLEMILPEQGALIDFFQKVSTLKTAIDIQEDFERLAYGYQLSYDETALLFGKKANDPKESNPSSTKSGLDRSLYFRILQKLEPYLSPLDPKDRLFAIDLCRLIIDSTRFSDELIEKVGSLSLETYRNLSFSWHGLESIAKEEEKKRFHEQEFIQWKKEHQKEFLSSMRKEEKEKKSYAKPYLDYLDRKEELLFQEHWEEKRVELTLLKMTQDNPLYPYLQQLSPKLQIEFCRTFRKFQDLDRPLFHRSYRIRSEKKLASSWLPDGGFGNIRSSAFQTTAPQGSVFKLITAYEGLRQGQVPTIIDARTKDPKIVAYTLSGVPYPRLYKGGRLPRSSMFQIGKIDLLGALEQSSNPYFSILAGDLLSDPEDLKEAAKLFGYGEKTGIDLPGEAQGKLPSDLKRNRTGLYSFAIGQHTLLNTPLQSAAALCAIANQGKLFYPKVAKKMSGLTPNRKELAIFERRGAFREKELKNLGIPFALFTAVKRKDPLFEEKQFTKKIKRELPLSPSIREKLLEGMDRTIWGEKGRARPDRIRLLQNHPDLAKQFQLLKHQLIGKTGTAQILHSFSQNPSAKPEMVTHTWFGAISFKEEEKGKSFEHPELVIAVFSRFSDSGKELAPLAGQIVWKWREIEKKSKE